MNLGESAYLAGLLDGDGSIILQLKPRANIKRGFRVKAVVVFYQDMKMDDELHLLRTIIGAGYMYRRNDRISEIRVEGFDQVRRLLGKLKPHIRFKRKQVELMLKAIDIMLSKKVELDGFLQVCQIADQISAANYVSRRRKYTYAYVVKELTRLGLVPVTTGSPPKAE